MLDGVCEIRQWSVRTMESTGHPCVTIHGQLHPQTETLAREILILMMNTLLENFAILQVREGALAGT